MITLRLSQYNEIEKEHIKTDLHNSLCMATVIICRKQGNKQDCKNCKCRKLCSDLQRLVIYIENTL